MIYLINWTITCMVSLRSDGLCQLFINLLQINICLLRVSFLSFFGKCLLSRCSAGGLTLLSFLFSDVLRPPRGPAFSALLFLTLLPPRGPVLRAPLLAHMVPSDKMALPPLRPDIELMTALLAPRGPFPTASPPRG